jgi:hypothetical protein
MCPTGSSASVWLPIVQLEKNSQHHFLLNIHQGVHQNVPRHFLGHGYIRMMFHLTQMLFEASTLFVLSICSYLAVSFFLLGWAKNTSTELPRGQLLPEQCLLNRLLEFLDFYNVRIFQKSLSILQQSILSNEERRLHDMELFHRNLWRILMRAVQVHQFPL